MTAFSSAVLELGPSPGVFASHHALAWILGEVRRRAPALSAALHEPNRAKPLTVWAGAYEDLGGAFTPRVPAARALVRVTALSEPVTTVLRRIAADRPDRATLGSGSFPIVSWALSAAAHPLAGESAPGAIAALLASGSGLPDRVTLHFLTPTAFDGEVAKTLFPLPTLVFRSILRKWNAHAGMPIDAALGEELLRRLQVEAHHLATGPLIRLRRSTEKGFVGWCEYSLGRGAPSEVVRSMHLLARAAFYTGIGARTTMGMGQAIAEVSGTQPNSVSRGLD